MKRMGLFCDTDDCKEPALGPCACCDKDVCSKHGSKAGITISVLRSVRDTTSLAQVAMDGVTTCFKCSDKLTVLSKMVTETVLPELLAKVGDAMKAALATEALR